MNNSEYVTEDFKGGYHSKYKILPQIHPTYDNMEQYNAHKYKFHINECII